MNSGLYALAGASATATAAAWANRLLDADDEGVERVLRVQPGSARRRAGPPARPARSCALRSRRVGASSGPGRRGVLAVVGHRARSEPSVRRRTVDRVERRVVGDWRAARAGLRPHRGAAGVPVTRGRRCEPLRRVRVDRDGDADLAPERARQRLGDQTARSRFSRTSLANSLRGREQARCPRRAPAGRSAAGRRVLRELTVVRPTSVEAPGPHDPAKRVLVRARAAGCPVVRRCGRSSARDAATRATPVEHRRPRHGCSDTMQAAPADAVHTFAGRRALAAVHTP